MGFDLELPLKTTEFVLECVITKLDGPDDSWFGFEFGDRYPGNYYQFLLSAGGGFRISKHWNNTWIDLGNHSGVRQLKRGNAENSLQVVRRGSKIHAFVNSLHVISVEDGAIRAGGIGAVVGWGIRAGLSNLRITGTDLEALCAKAMDHWNNYRVSEARELLAFIGRFEPAYKHPGHGVNIAELQCEIRPDRRKTVLLVVGSQIIAQIHDGTAAAGLREEINRRGRKENLEFACVVTDTSLLLERDFMEFPMISIGGPASNKLTAALADQLAIEPGGPQVIKVQHSMSSGDRRVALWGGLAGETTQAVDFFVSSGLLNSFLGMLWGRKIEA